MLHHHRLIELALIDLIQLITPEHDCRGSVVLPPIKRLQRGRAILLVAFLGEARIVEAIAA
jgi:hypothetical protein